MKKEDRLIIVEGQVIKFNNNFEIYQQLFQKLKRVIEEAWTQKMKSTKENKEFLAFAGLGEVASIPTPKGLNGTKSYYRFSPCYEYKELKEKIWK